MMQNQLNNQKLTNLGSIGNNFDTKNDLDQNQKIIQNISTSIQTENSGFKNITEFVHNKIKANIQNESIFLDIFQNAIFLANKGTIYVLNINCPRNKDLVAIESYIKRLLQQIWAKCSTILKYDTFTNNQSNLKSNNNHFSNLIANYEDNLRMIERINYFLNSTKSDQETNLNEFEQQFNKNDALFICGNSGSGKTSILKSCEQFYKQNNIRYDFFSADSFTSEYVRSIQNNSLFEFRKKIKSLDVMFLDNFDMLLTRKSTLNEFCENLCHFSDQGKKMIISSSRSKIEIMSEIPEKFKPFILQSLDLQILNPSFESKIKLFEKIFGCRNIAIDKNISILLSSILSNASFRDCVSFSILLANTFENNIQNISSQEICEIYNSYFEVMPQHKLVLQNQIQPNAIISHVCNFFDICVNEFKNNILSKNFVNCRRISIYLLKKIGQHKSAQIARYFNISPERVAQEYKNAIKSIQTNTSFKYDAIAIQNMIHSINKIS